MKVAPLQGGNVNYQDAIRQSGLYVAQYVDALIEGRGATDQTKEKGAVVLSQFVALEHFGKMTVEKPADYFNISGDARRKKFSSVISQARASLKLLVKKGQTDVVKSWERGEIPVLRIQTKRGLEDVGVNVFNVKRHFGDEPLMTCEKFRKIVQRFAEQEGIEVAIKQFNIAIDASDEAAADEVEVSLAAF